MQHAPQEDDARADPPPCWLAGCIGAPRPSSSWLRGTEEVRAGRNMVLTMPIIATPIKGVLGISHLRMLL